MAIGLMLVDRSWIVRVAPDPARRSVALGLTLAEIAGRYRGFDAEPWPLGAPVAVDEAGFARAEDAERLRSVLRGQEKPSTHFDLIGIERGERAPLELTVGGVLLQRIGYDVGYCSMSDGHFSAILNEVIWSAHPTLLAAARALNQDLLFALESDAKSLLAARQDLDSSVDLERWGPPLATHAIYTTIAKKSSD